ncbi:hypothetical protein K4K51_002787 [Colletotrichum sp. SAR 10_75]|nr:hypothetical protein K4K51_002787 [Colletotrichum sp. SAR 10_75]
MPIKAFPQEVLYHCLSHLPNSDLPAASLVCRSWLSPSREIYWSHLEVKLTDLTAKKLALILERGTTIPQNVRALCVDDPSNTFIDIKTKQSWKDNLIAIMDHFKRTSELVFECAELCAHSESQWQELLQAAQPQTSLIVKWLRVETSIHAMQIVLDQPHISFLGLGLVVVVERVMPWEEKKQADEIKKTEKEIAAITVRLGNLRHICLYSPEGPPFDKVWSHIVPALSRAQLPKLETLVAESPCDTNKELCQLINTTAATLRSLAISFDDPDILTLPKMPLLINLSICIDSEPHNQESSGVASALVTISSAPATLEHIFLHITPSTVKPEVAEEAQWKALDAKMAGMPRLRRITAIITMSVYLARTLMGPKSARRNINGAELEQKLTKEVLLFMKAQLAVCDSKGLVEVKMVKGPSWSRNAFADYDVGDMEGRLRTTSNVQVPP